MFKFWLLDWYEKYGAINDLPQRRHIFSHCNTSVSYKANEFWDITLGSEKRWVSSYENKIFPHKDINVTLGDF